MQLHDAMVDSDNGFIVVGLEIKQIRVVLIYQAHALERQENQLFFPISRNRKCAKFLFCKILDCLVLLNCVQKLKDKPNNMTVISRNAIMREHL